METKPTAEADERYLQARTFLEQGELDRALNEIEAARALYLAADEPDSALRTDLGRINVLDDLGRHHDSAEVGRSMLREVRTRREMRAELNNELLAWLHAAALENFGASLGWLGMHQAAAESLEQASTAYDEVGSKEDRARVVANLGVEYLEMGDHARALEHLDRAVAELAETGADELVGRAEYYRAATLAMAGRYGRALNSLADADTRTELSEGAGTSVDDLRRRAVRAEVLATLGLWADALKSAEELSTEFADRGLLRDRAHAQTVRSSALLSAGRMPEAGDAAALSAALYSELDLPVRAARAQLALAKCLDPDVARPLLVASLHSFDDAEERWGVAEAATHLAELSDAGDGQDKWIARALAAGADSYPELRWRTSLLLGVRAEHAGDLKTALSHLEESVETIRGLRRTVIEDHLRLPFMTGRRGPVEALLDLQLNAGLVDEALHTTSVERSWSLLDNRSTSSPTLSCAARPGTLTYQSIGDRFFVFVTDENGSSAVALPIEFSEVRSLNERLDAQWRRLADPRMRVHLESLRTATDQILQELYLGLVAPVEEALDRGPVTIVPTGSLASLPFHAFHDGSQYLVQRQQIAMAASPFVSDPSAHARVTDKTLVVGIPDALAPNIQVEVETIAELTDATMLVGGAASVGEVRNQVGVHDIIHLACHSEFDARNPELSSLQLNNGSVTAAEIATWNLRGTTVVMASCSSGRQANINVDEFDGLPRAMLAAGAHAVVVHLWPLNDEASVGVMSHLHLALKSSRPVAALRAAQLAAIDLFAHPYLWAPAVTYTARASDVDHRRI